MRYCVKLERLHREANNQEIYCIDIDGTICSKEDDFANAKPHKEIIDKINKLYDEGHKIIMFTARNERTKPDYKEITRQQLSNWGVKYHELMFGKPYADYYIDDKAVHINDWK